MFEFDELERTCPPAAILVSGAGSGGVDGIYDALDLHACCAPIFRHVSREEQLISRERVHERHGWLIGACRRPMYGARTESLMCPQEGWRAMQGKLPVPRVETFSSMNEACLKLVERSEQRANVLVGEGQYWEAVNVYKCVLDVPLLPKDRRVELHLLCARTLRQLATGGAQRAQTRDATENTSVHPEGTFQSSCKNESIDPWHALAAECAIEHAEEALRLDAQCYDAAWEGAVAAKQIGWWAKGRALAKRARCAVPSGPEHRAQREIAGDLFIALAQEEEAEKARKVKELRKLHEERIAEEEKRIDHDELQWALGFVTNLNDALKAEDFRRPHHQLWKLIGPGIPSRDADRIFGDIRELVWRKWSPLAMQSGYATERNVVARRQLCSRVVDVANTGQAPDVKDLIREIEDRVCLQWPDIPDPSDKPEHDETWAWTRRSDGSWGAWHEDAMN
eukprot:TRINITY_DN54783_c0_g1_i1.p1 TRINITY_DN54783_c0_g1~~TRINITY_DN54783_c0_g1_i1.p1  ORF type:complete len:452 (-),score=37.20 TRINITY_DN54783_c0_g1_i1:171-1526(-)